MEKKSAVSEIMALW